MPPSQTIQQVAKPLSFATALFLAVVAFGPITFAADITPPTTTLTQNPATPNGDNNWYNTPITFTLHAIDLESGVQSINYSIDGGTWQSVSYYDTLNLAINPSFELADGNNPLGVYGWYKTYTGTEATYSKDYTTYMTDYPTTSVKIVSTGSGWYAIENKNNFAAAATLDNMNASVWVKTQGTGQVYFDIYAVKGGGEIPVKMGTSNIVTGTNDWVQLSSNFVVHNPNAIGVYIEMGIQGSGTVWLDAVTISDSITDTSTNVTVATDNAAHTLEYYSIDKTANAEAHSCVGTLLNCAKFKIDQTAPGNWHDSGATRGLVGPNYNLYVYTNVDDETSGLSTFTDHYQYFTERNTTFGRYSDILSCSSTWQPDQDVFLLTLPFLPGANTAFITTLKTSFCNNDWSTCKIVRFFAKDMAGNSSYKDMCINGPWIKLSGRGIVRAEAGIDMLAEAAEGSNADSLIETGNSTINFFTSSKDWYAKNTATPDTMDYAKLYDITITNKTTITDGKPKNSSGVYVVNGDLTLSSNSLPTDFSGPNNSQIIFVNGTLTIEKSINATNEATILFVVKEDVNISEKVTKLNIGLFADGDVNTAYDIAEGETSNSLTLNGVFSANKFLFERTLQGTNNTKTASEEFVYEPKYTYKIKNFFRVGSVKWLSSD